MTLPLPSKRLTAIPGDEGDGWGVYYRALELQAAGERVTPLTIGEHDIRTDPVILDAMDRAAREGATGYVVMTGLPELRRAVAERCEARTGVKTTAENVLIVPGGQAGLFATHMGACQPGDRAAYIDPYYTTYPGTIRSAGAVPVPVITRAENGFLPEAQAVDAAAEGAASLLINTPNNPTGAVYGTGLLREIGAVVRDRGLWLISDEVYDSQVWEGAHVSPRAIPGLEEQVLVVGSMSKSHAMTGSRLGWIIGPVEMIRALGDLSTVTTYGVPGYIQKAGVYGLGLGPAFEGKIAAPFRRRRDLAQARLGQRRGLRLLPANAAMYVMADIRATGLSGEEFAWRLLEDHRVAVMPGESFGQAAAGHIRIALTVEDAALEPALALIGDLADRLADAARMPA
jgi:arginine:pyruvate transaminase